MYLENKEKIKENEVHLKLKQCNIENKFKIDSFNFFF